MSKSAGEEVPRWSLQHKCNGYYARRILSRNPCPFRGWRVFGDSNTTARTGCCCRRGTRSQGAGGFWRRSGAGSLIAVKQTSRPVADCPSVDADPDCRGVCDPAVPIPPPPTLARRITPNRVVAFMRSYATQRVMLAPYSEALNTFARPRNPPALATKVAIRGLKEGRSDAGSLRKKVAEGNG